MDRLAEVHDCKSSDDLIEVVVHVRVPSVAIMSSHRLNPVGADPTVWILGL
jgi:hypothetical protein